MVTRNTLKYTLKVKRYLMVSINALWLSLYSLDIDKYSYFQLFTNTLHLVITFCSNDS